MGIQRSSSQPAHARNLSRVFVVRMKKLCILGYPKIRSVKILIRMRECAGWSESSLYAHFQRYVFWCYVSYIYNWASAWQNQQNVRPAKIQISLGIRPAWSLSSLSAWGKLGSLATYWVHSEDSDQTGRMPRLICVFARRTCYFVGVAMRWLNYKLTLAILNALFLSVCSRCCNGLFIVLHACNKR